jgi:hypothetical protein
MVCLHVCVQVCVCVCLFVCLGVPRYSYRIDAARGKLYREMTRYAVPSETIDAVRGTSCEGGRGTRYEDAVRPWRTHRVSG